MGKTGQAKPASKTQGKKSPRGITKVGTKSMAPMSMTRETKNAAHGVVAALGEQHEQGSPEWPQLKLTAADRASLKFKAGRGLVRVLIAQAFMGLLAAAISWAFAGWVAGVSALIGAGAYFVPNALFAARLLLGLLGTKQASPFAFFIGEFIKLGSAVVLLALAAYMGQGWLVWPAVVFGLVCVLKGYVLLLFFRKLP